MRSGTAKHPEQLDTTGQQLAFFCPLLAGETSDKKRHTELSGSASLGFGVWLQRMWESGTSEPGQAQGRTHEEMKVGVGEMECQETGRLLLWQIDNQPETSNLWAVDKSSEMGPEGGPANPTEHEQPRGIAAERADLGACGCGRASSGSGAGQFLRYQEFDKRGTAVGLSEWRPWLDLRTALPPVNLATAPRQIRLPGATWPTPRRGFHLSNVAGQRRSSCALRASTQGRITPAIGSSVPAPVHNPVAACTNKTAKTWLRMTAAIAPRNVALPLRTSPLVPRNGPAAPNILAPCSRQAKRIIPERDGWRKTRTRERHTETAGELLCSALVVLKQRSPISTAEPSSTEIPLSPCRNLRWRISNFAARRRSFAFLVLAQPPCSNWQGRILEPSLERGSAWPCVDPTVFPARWEKRIYRALWSPSLGSPTRSKQPSPLSLGPTPALALDHTRRKMLLSHLRDTPREARGWRLWFSAWAVGALGISRGLDEGIISGVLKQHSFIKTFGFDDNSPQEATIASQLQLGSVAGSAIAFFLCDRLGRLRTSMLACLLWLFGTAIWMTSAGVSGTHSPGNYHQLLAGRFIAGLGVGFTPVVAPVYLAEIAPKAIRGLTVCIFSGSVYIGILLGYWSNLGTSIHYDDARQWTIPASINFIFAGLTFIACIFAKESPRWLIKQGRYEEGRKTLSYLRNLDEDHPYIVNEVEVMEQQILAEKEALEGLSIFQILKKLVTNKNNQYILFLGLGIQVLGQMSGGGVYTVFAPKIFGLLGVPGGQRTKLLTTGIFGIVKLLSSLAAAFFLVDMLGRKTAVTTGLLLQSLCSLYLALFLKFTSGVTKANETHSDKSAATGAIFFFYLSGLAWAIGVNSVQYLTQTEMFDITVRALGVAIVSLVHFAMQYAATRSLNPMLHAWGNFGTFLFYAMIALTGCLFVFFFMPETAGMQLEDIHQLFEKPWYRIGWTANRPANRKGATSSKVEADESQDGADLAYSAQLGQKKSIEEEEDEKKH